MNVRNICFPGITAVTLAVVLGMTPGIMATTLERMSFEQLARAAGTIVRARCVGTSSRWEEGAIWTFSDFEALEPLKGAPPQRIRVRLPGGRVGHITTRVEAVPSFQTGEEDVLFLETNRAGDYSVTAWAEGTFRIHTISRSAQEVVTQDSSNMPVFDSATRQFRSEGMRNLPLAEFSKRLAAALAPPRTGISR